MPLHKKGVYPLVLQTFCSVSISPTLCAHSMPSSHPVVWLGWTTSLFPRQIPHIPLCVSAATCTVHFSSVHFSLVAQLCPTLCDPVDCSTQGLPVHHQLPEFTQTHVHWVGDATHLILCHPLLPPSIFPSIRDFSKELVLYNRWPKYWTFSFSISPSNAYSLGLNCLHIPSAILECLLCEICQPVMRHHSYPSPSRWSSSCILPSSFRHALFSPSLSWTFCSLFHPL